MIKVILLFLFLLNCHAYAQELTPLRNTHSHNDYYQTNPLFDALDNGICSIEADIFLLDNELYVAHEKEEINKKNTLKKLYLEPLNEILKDKKGKYENLFPLQLLIDIKSEALPTYLVLHYQLKEYKNIITTFIKKGKRYQKEIDVIISGNRAKDSITNSKERYAAIDGRIEDIKQDSFLYPLISDNWYKVLKHINAGEDKELRQNKLKALADEVHQENKKLRLWAVPDNAEHWGLLLNAGIDLIGTDQPAELKKYLLTLTEDIN